MDKHLPTWVLTILVALVGAMAFFTGLLIGEVIRPMAG